MNDAILLPHSLDEAVDALAREPAALPVAGGTDLMPRVNAGMLRPRALLGLAGIGELRQWQFEGRHALIGACVTWARLAGPDLAALVPALATAARQVGTPQIRMMGTLGGNLVARTREADAVPVLAALEATVLVRSAGGVREFVCDGEPGAQLRAGELITGVRVPVLHGPQEFLKARVSAGFHATLALVVDPGARTVRCAVGGIRPGAERPTAAERWLSGRLDPASGHPVDARDAATFGAMVADGLSAGDGPRPARAHEQRVVAALARRAAERAFAA
ncbi:FAD binding domain-containing protein [Yinghuangia seranimata]|uniref:FAD binding domain-containing protein n=1 Tax=Yinghuangia seranimata TaxID=408067 RepID=UPI00248C69D1|nr:FAD binding domain-containing protein [Yinghuangia seranimata]MDI2131403.1 FAD binding domain-containing protein [Yinghuangia seranimata]